MKFGTLLIIISIIVLLGYIGLYYIFSIYEVTYEVTPPLLYADDQSTVIIKATPINSMGKKAPFRFAACKFEIIEGEDLVQILKDESDSGILILKSKDLTGNVIVRIKSIYSLMPSEIKIEILKNAA